MSAIQYMIAKSKVWTSTIYQSHYPRSPSH